MDRVKTYQSCDSSRMKFEVVVPSSSDPKKTYTITGAFVDGAVACSCPGFTYRHQCKHIKIVAERCGWSAETGPETQNEKQKEDRECPRCGGRTVETMQGSLEY